MWKVLSGAHDERASSEEPLPTKKVVVQWAKQVSFHRSHDRAPHEKHWSEYQSSLKNQFMIKSNKNFYIPLLFQLQYSFHKIIQLQLNI